MSNPEEQDRWSQQSPVEQLIASAMPPLSSQSRDHLLFESGFAAGNQRQGVSAWKKATACLTVCCLALGSFAAWQFVQSRDLTGADSTRIATKHQTIDNAGRSWSTGQWTQPSITSNALTDNILKTSDRIRLANGVDTIHISVDPNAEKSFPGPQAPLTPRSLRQLEKSL